MKRVAFVLFSMLPALGSALVGRLPMPPAVPPLSIRLDPVIQERFGHITQEDIEKGRLGVSRVARPPRSTHLRRFTPVTDVERESLRLLGEQGWSASLFVQGLGSGMGLDGPLTGPIRTDQEAFPGPLDRAKVRTLALKAIAERKGLQDAWGAYRVEARPIPVSGPSCAGCHDPSLKLGDPLGSVVYVFHRPEQR